MQNRHSFQGCTEWSCMYHGAYLRLAAATDCRVEYGSHQLDFILSAHEVQCIICGTSYGLIETPRKGENHDD